MPSRGHRSTAAQAGIDGRKTRNGPVVLGNADGPVVELEREVDRFLVRRVVGEVVEIPFSRRGAAVLHAALEDFLEPAGPALVLWDADAIAKHYGIAARSVRRNWIAQDSFPEPRADLAIGKVWDAAAVKRWARLHRRGPGRPPKS